MYVICVTRSHYLVTHISIENIGCTLTV